MANPALSLLVLRTAQMDKSLAFYRSLGLGFVEEKHGSGPVHYSTQIGSIVMEIYPGEAAPAMNRKAAGATMIGLAVDSVDSVVASAQKLCAEILTTPSDSSWGRRAVVLDPDGRAIELSQPKPA
jgi:predicted enzyme related to lactoylglutathione lyase